MPEKTKLNLIRYVSLWLVLSSMFLVIAGFKITGGVTSTIVVPDDYATVQEAVDAAYDGDTIRVKPGVFNEHIEVDGKSIYLLGSGNSTILQSDGQGHTVDIKRGTNNVTVSGFLIVGVGNGPWAGINVRGRFNNLSDNIVINHTYGIYIWDSSGNVLRNNNMTGNHFNLKVWGLTLEQFVHDIDTTNLVGGRRVYYWVSQRSKTIPSDAGYVAIVNSSNIIVKDLNLTNNFSGVLLTYTSNSVVSNVTAAWNEEGIRLIHAHGNVFVRNNVSNNVNGGFSLVASSSNVIAGNTVRNNTGWGISLELDSLSAPPLPSTNNSVRGNLVVHNREGVWIDRSRGNIFYRDTFMNNTAQVKVSSGAYLTGNDWNGSYSTGGNYWSDYSGVDLRSGAYQNLTGSDGIGDTPYTIDEQNSDRYPWICPVNQNLPPSVDFVYWPLTPRIGEVVGFEEKSVDADGETMLWLWDFGGNDLTVARNPKRQFIEAGNKTILLTVFDDEGAWNITGKVLFVRKHFSFLTLIVPEKAGIGQTISVSAVLKDEEWNPLPNSDVGFYIVQGDLVKHIGSSETNSTGVSTVQYYLEEAGAFLVYATYNGSVAHLAATAPTSELIVAQDHLDNIIPIMVGAAFVIVIMVIFKWRRQRKADAIQ